LAPNASTISTARDILGRRLISSPPLARHFHRNKRHADSCFADRIESIYQLSAALVPATGNVRAALCIGRNCLGYRSSLSERARRRRLIHRPTMGVAFGCFGGCVQHRDGGRKGMHHCVDVRALYSTSICHGPSIPHGV